MASQPRTCADCGLPLSRRNSSGLCKRHFGPAMTPETRAKISEARLRRFASDPAFKARQGDLARAAANTPQSRAASRATLIKTRAWIAGNAAQPKGSPSRLLAAERAALTKLSWCPPHLRDKYRVLVRKSIPSSEARRIILEEHEIEMRRWRKSVGAEPVVMPEITPSKGVLYIDRASATAAAWVGVPDIWVRDREKRIVRARWAVYLALHRGGWSVHRISAETGMERKGVGYGLAKAEILASIPGEFAGLLRAVVAA